MVDKKQDQEKQIDVNNWTVDIDKASVKKIADLNIIPQLSIVALDTKGNFSNLTVKVKTLPKLTRFADGNDYFVIFVEQNDMVYQMVCSAVSFRQQLAVIIYKEFNDDSTLLIGQMINITKQIAEIDTPKFKGKAEVYLITLIK